MKIIALEEHYCQPEISTAWDALPADLNNDRRYAHKHASRGG